MRTAKQRANELKRLAALRDDDIDTSDIPEQVDWSKAVVGKFYRPVKKQVTLRIDADVLAWFKAQGGKYQSAVNAALREHVAKQPIRIGTTRRTGETCPESGIWIAEGKPPVAISAGNRFPPSEGKPVIWTLLKAA